MALTSTIKNNKRYRNYISALVATHKTGEVLEPYTEQGLQDIHDQIHRNLGNLPRCHRQCSRIEKNTTRWCLTCSQWKIALEHHLTHAGKRNITWSHSHSWTWPCSAKDISEVFIAPGWDTNNINLKDVSTAMMIWKKCTWFPRQLVTLGDQLREDRNEIAHSTTLNITTTKKASIFQHIRNVVNHQDVKVVVHNYPQFMKLLQELEKGKLFRFENDVKDALQHIRGQNAEIISTLNSVLKKISAILFVCILLSISIIIGVSFSPECLLIHSSSNRARDSGIELYKTGKFVTTSEGCLTEAAFNIPSANVSLYEYISHHKNFVGREWLFKILERQMVNLSSRGVLLQAAMGYGKSAIMAHIICSNNQTAASGLRKLLVAYHVCRFDVLVSKHVHIFIFRLLEMMSRQVTELSESMKSCMDIFDKISCEEDPNGCLDQCVIIPLKQVQNTRDAPLLIILDALDECYDPYRKENAIFVLLKHRIHRFPTRFKFLITSRFTDDIKDLYKELMVIRLMENDEKNKRDILTYVDKLREQSSLDIPLSISNNFLIVTSYRESIEFSSGIPKSLDRYYEEQLARTFGQDSAFNDAGVILEVICSLFQAPDEALLWNIISNTTDITHLTFLRTLKRLENVLNIIDGKYHIKHVSIQQWFVQTANKHFRLNMKSGHARNAEYMFRNIELTRSGTNIIDLVIHVALASNPDLEEKMLNLTTKQLYRLKENIDEYPIIALTRRIDSYKSTDLLAHLYKDVDFSSEKIVSAVFVAASLGHLETLKALLHHGVDITVRTDKFKEIITFNNMVSSSFSRQFGDYGVLDIAAQNGHERIVNFIIENNGVMFVYPIRKRNPMGLLPIHFACKRGHFVILEMLSKKFHWMLDWLCLYYASENGQYDMVNYLLQAGIIDKRPSCRNHFGWHTDPHLLTLHSYPYDSPIMEDKGVLSDEWMNKTGESALQVAVRMNRTDIVKLLIKHKDSAIEDDHSYNVSYIRSVLKWQAYFYGIP